MISGQPYVKINKERGDIKVATKAEKLKSGNYRSRASYIDETGKQRFKSFTAPDAKQARLLAQQFENDLVFNSKVENISLRDAINRYIENRENILSPSTVVGYEQLVRNAYPSIIDRRIGVLTREDIQKAINDYSKNHSAKSVHNAYGLLSVVLKELYPTLDIKNIKLPQKKKSEIVIPTKEELDKIIDATKDTELHLPILLSAFLGLRRSEIFGLTPNDINLKQNTITIDNAMVRDRYGSYVDKTTKTESSQRTLQIPKIIREELEKIKGDPIEIDYKNFSQRYGKICEKLGVPTKFHALRHYNASLMLQLNVPNKYAMERMGHATDNMLKRVYQHTFKSEQDAIANRIDEYLNNS